jgi:Lon protease-like protein
VRVAPFTFLQEFLHVLAPHYVHMFEAIFSRPRPWLFGHLLLPAGSKNLGAPAYRLASGTQAPLVGVLVQVTRAVRLRDGKFLILATACARFKVR